ncbi:MAG: glycosyltransferase, partial [Elusimicrobia bacterium]|nr:glycosyltransferase [Elusimicrobiota bacterium]
NSGPSNVRNIGIKNATGIYIAFIDSDDFVSLNYLEKLYKHIDGNNYDVVYCKHKLYYNLEDAYHSSKSENELPKLTKKINLSQDKNFILKNLLFLVENARSVCMKMYRLDTIRNNNVLFFEDIYAQCDYIYNILFAMYSLNNISFIDEELYFYRKQVKSISADKDKMAINGIRSFIVLTKSLEERNFICDNKIMLGFILNEYIKRLGKKFSKEKQKLIFSEIKEHFYYLKKIFSKLSFSSLSLQQSKN